MFFDDPPAFTTKIRLVVLQGRYSFAESAETIGWIDLVQNQFVDFNFIYDEWVG